MTYLIISIYDGGHGFSVCENGKVIPQTITTEESFHAPNPEIAKYEVAYLKGLHGKSIWDEPWKQEFAKLDYDLIIVCEDGGVEILKKPQEEK